MSEANIPSPRLGLSESQKIVSDWGELSLPASRADSGVTPLEDVWEDWQTVDFPNALSVDAIPRQSPAASEDNAPAELPPAEELIALIQDLNQCNTLLLDRVAHLETNLERSQIELHAEIQRNQDIPAVEQLAAAQEQIVQLSNQLEFIHQSSQRQQILVETLTAQLESSQERVAQLERECSLTQQRCSEQAQQLMESETACRDLRIRLQRQQRYTLQFKAALEKCLDVPPPHYEAVGEAIGSDDHTGSSNWDETSAATPPLVPRISRIQPWSSQPQFPVLDLGSEAEHDRLSRLSVSAAASPFVSYDLKPKSPDQSISSELDRLPQSLELKSAEPDDELVNKLDDKSESESETATLDSEEPIAPLENQIDISQTLDRQIAVAVQQLADFPIAAIESETALPEQSDTETATPESEDALWQDLARMIDSSEDMSRAGIAKTSATFAASPETEQFEAEPRTAELPLASFAAASVQTVLPSDTIAQAIARQISTQSQADSAEIQSNWPSPLVYPLRPSRKLRSLAAVDLPTFPR